MADTIESLRAELDIKTRALKSQLDIHQAFEKMMRLGLQNWRERVVLIYDYVAPFTKVGDKHFDGSDSLKVAIYDPMWDIFLRFETKPVWDVYGSDYGTEKHARKVLTVAPEPPNPACIIYGIMLKR